MDAIIKVENLKKYFKEVKAVDDISFSVERGELFGFLGGEWGRQVYDNQYDVYAVSSNGGKDSD